MKNFLRYLIMVCMAVSLLSANIITSSAYSETKYGDYMYYCVENSGKVTITDCDNEATEIVIPSEIDGNPVTRIGDDAFSYCRSLTSIAIPDTVVSIGSFAFSGCDSLTSITIPNSVTSMGYYSFCDCKNLTDIIIPKSITRIGNNAFSRCNKLKRVNISDIDAWCGIKFVNATSNPLCNGGKLYINNKVVTKVTLSESVTTIGDYAFSDCSSLIDIIMPNTVTSIGECAFSQCDSLKSITIPESVSSIGISAFSGCESLNEITMPKSITSIGDSAFSGCEKLTNITIPTGVTSIGDNTFSYCSSLTNITIPDSVTSIGDDAFFCCSSLTNITIPDGVTSIGDSAFCDCRALKSINIPNSIKSIGDHTFHDCGSLANIIIPENVTLIGDYVFSGCNVLTYIALPKTLTEINKYAFDGCSSLSVIFFGGSKEEWEEIYIASGNDALSTATVVYNAAKKTYKFETNCDSTLADVTDYAVMSSPKVANSDKTLLGWYDNENLAGNPIVFPYYGNATTLYAAWTDKTGLSFEDAFLASANHEYSVTIGENGQNVYYEFVPRLSGEYRFYSKGNFDTYGYLYDSDKRRLASDDDSGENSNFKITCNLNAGETYYIAVKIYNETGTFVLVTETDCAEGTKTVCVTGNKGEKIFVSVPNYLPEDAKIILACYKDNALAETQIAENKNETLYFTVKKDFNRAKVMVWNSLTSLKPICKAEIVIE